MSSLTIAPAFVPVRPARHSTVRLTRRGRLVVFLASLLLVLAVALALGAAAVGGGAGSAPHYDTWVVGSGETLGGIARSTGTSVFELEQINGLDSASIQAGQRLQVPTP